MAHTSENTYLLVADDATVSDGISVADFARGSIGPFPTGFVTADVTLQVANAEDPVSGDWKTLQDTTGAAVAAISAQAAGDVFALNSNVFSYRHLRLSFGATQTGGPLKIPIFLQGDT